MINDTTIIIPTRANLEYLQAAISSIRDKSQYDAVKILVGADNPPQEVRDWLAENNKGQYDYTIYEAPTGKERTGIVNMVEDLVERVKTKFVYYMHDDMIIGEKTLENLVRAWKNKRILSSFRVEPPIYQNSKEKLLADIGTEPSEFDANKFSQIEQDLCQENKKVLVEGFFAPHFFAKKDWVGYDHIFEPQSREDSDLAQRFLDDNCELYTVWDSVVYHFSGKGSRKKDSSEDSQEWKMTNYKNTRNYIRKWKTLKHTEYILPLRAPDIKVGATVLACDRDVEYVDEFLDNVEPWFDEIVFIIDSNTSKITEVDKAIKQFIKKQESFKPTNFNSDKIIIKHRPLNGDFASQTNAAISALSEDINWVMKLDLDEKFPEQMLGNMRDFIKDGIEQNPNLRVIGFPRMNILDNKVSNDIPRKHWFTEHFNQYPDRPERVNNPDVQFRLHHRKEKWVNEVHELPMSVAQKDIDRYTVIKGVHIVHPKSRQRQYIQEQQYHSILSTEDSGDTEIEHFIYDSVLYTYEGITKHAREEMLELSNRGKTIFTVAENYKEGFGEEFKQFHTPFNTEKHKYVTIVNQPPARWNNSQHLKNRIGYLAFEGELPSYWVKQINESNVLEVWTPSQYCKEMFEKSGVKKNVVVIPHGINPEVWKPLNVVQDQGGEKLRNSEPFTFLAAGTFHNSRKGFDILVQAFEEEFSENEPVRLLCKVNKIYNPKDSFNKYINKHLDNPDKVNIEYLDSNLTEQEMVELFNSADVYVSPHRAEGFGINILNALAVGTPVITSGETGEKEFVNEERADIIASEGLRWSPFIPPYDNAKWPEPSKESLRNLMREAYESYASKKKRALEVSDVIREEHTWKAVVDKMLSRIRELSL